jgi:DOPA 4,5-dioxygenase
MPDGLEIAAIKDWHAHVYFDGDTAETAFKPDLFGELVPWLALNRCGLVIFIHPNTGDDLSDHRDHPLWLGDKRGLDLSIFA